MKKIWKNIVNAGVNQSLSLREEKTVRLVNIIMIVFITVTILVFPVIVLARNWVGVLFAIMGVTFYSLVIFLNFKQFHTWANHFFVGYTVFIITLANLLFGKAVGSFFAFIPMTILPIFVFKKNNTIYAYLTIIVLIFYFVSYYQAYFPPIINRDTSSSYEIRYFVNITAILACTFLISFFFRRINDNYEEILVNKNKIIAKKNQDITDSINYAKRIQEAILPQKDLIQKAFPQHFIFYKPRDIVSGDFYFFEEKSDKIILATIDCTGHGVPGAFMSMIGKSLLNQIILENKILEPHLILDELHTQIQIALNQEQTRNHDGMDMSLLVIDKKNKTIKFAGAKNPLIYFQNGEMNIIKADRFSVGGDSIAKNIKFTTKEVIYDSPLTLYLFSDGFQDQFGGKEGKKFMRSQFYDLLNEVSFLPINQQEKILEKRFTDWKGNKVQVDDILVIGVKLL